MLTDIIANSLILVVFGAFIFYHFQTKIKPIKVTVREIDGVNDYELAYLNMGKKHALKTILYFLARKGLIKMYPKTMSIRFLYNEKTTDNIYEKTILNAVLRKLNKEKESRFDIEELLMDQNISKTLDKLFDHKKTEWSNKGWIVQPAISQNYYFLKTSAICLQFALFLCFIPFVEYFIILLLSSVIGIGSVYFCVLEQQNIGLKSVLNQIKKNPKLLIVQPRYVNMVINGQ